MNNDIKEKELKEINLFIGHEDEFKKYNDILNQKIHYEYILYYDEQKTKIKYKGELLNDNYEGRGKLYDNKGNILYDGFFEKGLYKNFRKEYKSNKLIYEGFFDKGKYNGKGILYTEKYNEKYKLYEGYFKDGKYDGIGLEYFYFEKNKISFRGIFKDGKYENGILYDLDGKIIYKGEFLNNIPKEGKNIKLYKLNGDLIYEGDLFDFKYNGYGKIYKKFKSKNF